MNICITGVSGFIGSHLAIKLLKNGHKIIGLTRTSSLLSEELHCTNFIRENCNGEYQSFVEVFRKYKIDVICHLAADMSNEDESYPSRRNIVQMNINWSWNMIEAAVSLNIRKVINTGTHWQHFNNLDYYPVNLYAATKKAFQDLLFHYACNKEMNVIDLHIPDTYGPNDKRKKLINYLLLNEDNSKTLELTPGEQEFSILHISDVVEAYLICISYLNDKPKTYQRYSIYPKNRITLKEFVEKYIEIRKSKIHITWSAKKYRDNEMMISWRNDTLPPGWNQQITLEDGLVSL